MSLTQKHPITIEMQLLSTLINLRQQYESVLGTRLTRGCQLAEDSKVTQVAADVWTVATFSGNGGRYIIDWTPNYISCSCHDGNAPDVECFCGVKASHCCIHIIAVVMTYLATSTQPGICAKPDDNDELEDDNNQSNNESFIAPPAWNSYQNASLDSFDLAIRNYGPAHLAKMQHNGH